MKAVPVMIKAVKRILVVLWLGMMAGGCMSTPERPDLPEDNPKAPDQSLTGSYIGDASLHCAFTITVAILTSCPPHH